MSSAVRVGLYRHTHMVFLEAPTPPPSRRPTTEAMMDDLTDMRRARRRWRLARAMITLPIILNRLRRSEAVGFRASNQTESRGMVGHAAYLRKLSIGVRHGGVVENALVDVRIDRAVSEAARLAEDGSQVVTTVGSEAEVGHIAMWQQGDVALATRAKFEERFRLRQAPEINEVLHAFWTAAIRGSGGEERKRMDANSPGLLDMTVGFDEFFALFSRVYQTLMDDFDYEDARKTIWEDFLNDSKGDNLLTHSEYGDSASASDRKCNRMRALCQPPAFLPSSC